MVLNKTISIILHLCLSSALLSCKEEGKPKAATVFEVADEHLRKDVDKSATNLSIPINTNLAENEWKVNYTEKWLSAFKSANKVDVAVQANSGDKRVATIDITSSNRKYTVTVTQYGGNDVVVDTDVPVTPYGGKASEYQSNNYNIDKTYDGKFTVSGSESHYHSLWNGTQLPVTLEYYFRGDSEIDYFIYYTRSGNGNFGQVDVYTATDTGRGNYTLQGSYDFQEKSSPSKISFKEGVKATGVKFVVKSGKGGFVSCDEMQFFKANTERPLENRLLAVFTDITCTELRSGVADGNIQAMPEYFIRIAETLKNDTYDAWEKSFRVREYEAYSDVDVWATKLMTRPYSNLDNLTGIAVQKDDEVIVLVGDTHGQDITIQCVGEERSTFLAPEGQNYAQTAAKGDVYFLQPGVNKLTIKNQGQLFVMYTADLSTRPKPIKIHIPPGSGKVSGFFDIREHKTDQKYAELLAKATDKYFGIRGDRIIFYFHRSELLSVARTGILSGLEIWENVIGWQQELMGIEDVRPNSVNNHIFAISPEGAFMWASDYRIAFTVSTLGGMLSREKFMSSKDNAWGPAHEIGHIHQGAINWPSSTESSNNLFSNYVIYKLGKFASRGTELNMPKASDNITTNSSGAITKLTLSQAHCVLNRPWYNFGDGHQGENTEMHCRMNWQLWNYYHRCGHNPEFWPTLFKLLRENRPATTNPGEKQLLFARMASEAAKEDLSEFFEMWGFFVPVAVQLEQYGNYFYSVTQTMIDETKAAMAKYPKARPFYYIEDRKNGDGLLELNNTPPDVGHYSQFQTIRPITKAIKGSISGKNVTITDGDEAVAYELRESSANGKLLYFSTFASFEIPSSIPLTNAKLFAVQADGTRVGL